MQYYSTTTMAKEFEAEGVHGCEQCHGNHLVEETNDAMVGVGEQSVCMDCHAEGDDGYEAAKEIHNQLTGLVALYDSAKTKQEKVRRIGMDDVDIEFQLQESHQSLIQARTLVHTFSAERVAEKTGEGIEKARQALEMAREEIKENQVRRLGFGVATLFITVLVVALFFKVRDIEKRQKS
jgi:predicted CXXCH cytochrome family protein